MTAWLTVLMVAATTRAGDTGSISGTLLKPEPGVKVTAIDRATDKKYPGKVDEKTGRFTLDGLPLNTTFDCVVDAGAARLEGVNLKVPRSDYEEEQPMTKEDVEALIKTAKALNKFENVVEVLAVRGNIQHAAVLLHKVRTEPFINSKPGEVVWRAELWHFEKPDETWIKVQDELFLVYYRERLPKSDFDKKAVTFDPALGGITLSAKQPEADVGKVEMPPKEPGIRLRAERTKPADGGR